MRNENCTLCDLHKNAINVCIDGVGPLPAPILIVGQAPGYQEDQLGRPFIGPSGALLRELIEPFPFSVRITNAARCYPPRDAKPTLTQIAACRPYLIEEIIACKPEVIIALGDTALQALCGTSGVGKNRGKPLDLRVGIQKALTPFEALRELVPLPKVLATWHPAFVLRDLNHEEELEEDMASAVRYVRHLRGEEVGQTVDWREWLHFTGAVGTLSDVFSYDIETNGARLGSPEFRITMLGVSNGTGQWVTREPSIIHDATLSLQAFKIVGHNAIGFDAIALGLPETEDTMLMSYAYNERPKSHSLQSSVIRNLQIPPWKDQVEWKWAEFDPMTSPLWELAAQYNARDVKYTYDLYTFFRERMDSRQTKLYEHLLKPAQKMLTQMELRGIPISTANMQRALAECMEKIETTSEEIKIVAELEGFENFNPRSTKQLAKLLFEKIKYPVHHLTEGGEPSTDAETLQALALQYDNPLLGACLEFREYDKLRSTYLIDKKGEIVDGRAHPSYALTETETGRTTGYGFLNPQRQPRKTLIRRCVAAPPGKLLMVADLSQIELRTMAFLSREPNMLRVYREGLFGGDMHSFTAQKIAEQRGESTFTKEDRSEAKPVNFACLYGAEWYTVQKHALEAYGIRISPSQAQFLRDEVFFGSFPGLPDYYRSVLKEVKSTGVVFSPLGRRRRVPNIVASDAALREEAARQAINMPNQSFASDIALIGAFLVESNVPDVSLCAFVHDAIIGEVDFFGNLAAIKEHVRYTFEESVVDYIKGFWDVEFDVPIKVDVTFTKEWGVGD